MKLGVCDSSRETYNYIDNLLGEKKLSLGIDEVCAYTVTELQMDLEEFVFDCDILIINTAFPQNKMSGLDIAKLINQCFAFCKIIYIAEKMDDISEVYETEHCYLMLKKDLEEKLEKALEKAIKLLKQEDDEKKVELICEGHHVFLRKPDVMYVEKKGRVLSVVTKHREFKCYMSLSRLLELFDNCLIRVHGSYLVNGSYITYIGSDSLELISKRVIPIGRTYTKELKKIYYGKDENQDAK